MKYIFSCLLCCLFLAPATAQKLPQDAISSFFSEYVDNEDFTVVYVSGKVFSLFQDLDLELDDIDDKEVAAILDVVQDIQGIRVLHTEKNVAARYAEARKRIPTSSYELLFKVRTAEGDNVEAFIQDDNSVVSELFMVIGSGDTFALLSFVGAIDLTKIGDLQRALND